MENTFIILTISAIGIFVGYTYLSSTEQTQTNNKVLSAPDKITNGFNGIFGNSTLNNNNIPPPPTDPEKLKMYNLALQSIKDLKTRVAIKFE